MRNDNRTLRMRQVRRLRSGESRYLQEKDEKTDLSKREVRQVSRPFHPPTLHPPFFSLFTSSIFSPLSVYVGLQNADLIRDNLTLSTRSCFDEFNSCSLVSVFPAYSLLPKLCHWKIFRP